MDAQQLEAFVAVAETGSFSIAAERIHLTQPAVSKRVALLEHQLDCLLFDRIARHINLTESGNELLPKARQILQIISDTEQAIHDLSGKVTGRLKIALSHHIGLHRAPDILKRFATTYPEVALDVDFMDSEIAYQEINKGSFDVAVVTLAPEPKERVQSNTIWVDPLVLVTANDHPLIKKRKLTASELGQYPAILPGLSTYTGKIIKDFFDQEGNRLNISMVTNYLETIKIMVSVGFGWSMLPMTMVDQSLTPIKCKGLSLSRRLGYIHHRDRSLSNASRRFIDFLEDEKDSHNYQQN